MSDPLPRIVEIPASLGDLVVVQTGWCSHRAAPKQKVGPISSSTSFWCTRSALTVLVTSSIIQPNEYSMYMNLSSMVSRIFITSSCSMMNLFSKSSTRSFKLAIDSSSEVVVGPCFFFRFLGKMMDNLVNDGLMIDDMNDFSEWIRWKKWKLEQCSDTNRRSHI